MSDSCHFCDETECLEKHHIVPRRYGGTDIEENLVEVCPTCHRKLESLYDKRFYSRLSSASAGLTDYAVFECRECGWKFIAEIDGEFPSCPQCMTKDDRFIQVNKVSDKFVEFGDAGKLDDCKPSRNYFAWYENSSPGIEIITHTTYTSRIDAQEKAWRLGMNEKVENAGFLLMVSLDELDDLETLTSNILDSST